MLVLESSHEPVFNDPLLNVFDNKEHIKQPHTNKMNSLSIDDIRKG